MLGEQATQFQMAAKSEDIDDQNCFPSRQFFDCLGYIIFRETGIALATEKLNMVILQNMPPCLGETRHGKFLVGITHGILCHENFF